MSFFEPWSLSLNAWLAWIIYWIIAGLFSRKNKSTEGFLLSFRHSLPLYFGFWLMLHGRHPAFLGRLYDNTGVEAAGVVVTFAGLLFSVWARVHLGGYWSGRITLKEGHRLIRTGPYQLVRHPIYTGIMTAAAGSAMTASTLDAVVGMLVIWIACLLKVRWEEALLTGEFPDEYPRFKREVPALVPYQAWRLLKDALAADQAGQTIDSDAFRAAALDSEQFRIIGTLLILGFLTLVGITRSLIDPQRNDYQRMGIYLVVLLAAVVFELILLGIARRARQAERRVPWWVWGISTLIECSFPTLVILGLTADKSYMGPYLALVGSPVLIYFLFIILATMRLDPWLCILSGAVCGSEYLGLLFFTRWVAPHNLNRNVLPPITFVMYAADLFFAGLLAAGVTRRIRRHVAAALEEVQTRRKLDRVEYDLNTARSIQMGLLPKHSPDIPGYDIAGWSQPADQTGGDYYDWMALPNNRLLFTIADASGHGIGPALLITACRAYFRAIVQRADPLEHITRQVDTLLTADTPGGRFITAAIALLEPEMARLSLYSAGHGPIYFYSAATDQITLFDADQPPLGMGMSDAETSRARVMSLSPGDLLVLVTDGFFEWANPAGEQLGTGRLGELIRRHRALEAGELIQQLRQEVLAFSQGTVQTDDLTAVVIKRSASASLPS